MSCLNLKSSFYIRLSLYIVKQIIYIALPVSVHVCTQLCNNTVCVDTSKEEGLFEPMHLLRLSSLRLPVSLQCESTLYVV